MVYYFKKQKRRIPKHAKKTLGIFIIFCGLGFLSYIFLPLFLYQVFFGFSQSQLGIPIPKDELVSSSSVSNLIKNSFSNLTTNFNDARNWYPNLSISRNSPISKYSISIPKLDINNAEVSTVDYDLTKHLIQYAGTSIPGQKGTSIIFGHSTLPQWFNPEDYKTIFSNLHKIKNNDVIYAHINGIKYKYKVFSITITDPEDTKMFDQTFDNSYITIITCTPPGTIWKRLVVRASLQDYSANSQNKDIVIASN